MKKTDGVGILTVLTIVFVVLKLTGLIAWSWWWVFSPVLFAFGVAIIGLIILIIVLSHRRY